MTVTFEITGVRNDRGLVRGLAFMKNDGGFPETVDKAIGQAEVTAQKGTVKLVFKGIPASKAAFSFFHDEKEIGKIDKNFLGIPKCGVGASLWNGKGRPNYASCLVKVESEMQATLKYF